jgi:hypothetical protein
MSEADTILRDCRRFDFHLRRDGDRIAIEPPRRCPAEVLAMLRAHKQEALDLLDTAALILTPDCVPQPHVARQVLSDRFNGANNSTAGGRAVVWFSDRDSADTTQQNNTLPPPATPRLTPSHTSSVVLPSVEACAKLRKA